MHLKNYDHVCHLRAATSNTLPMDAIKERGLQAWSIRASKRIYPDHRSGAERIVNPSPCERFSPHGPDLLPFVRCVTSDVEVVA